MLIYCSLLLNNVVFVALVKFHFRISIYGEAENHLE